MRRRRLAGALAVAAAALALSGCLLTPDRLDTNLDIPEAYRAAPARPDAALPAIDWWRGFRSAELTALMEAALAANFDIAAAAARVQQADANLRIATAALLPAVDLNASTTRTRPASSSSSSTAAATRSIYNTNFGASYLVDFWGRYRDLYSASQQSAIASRFDYDVVTMSALSTVANAYFQVAAAQDRLRIARNNFQAADRILKLIKDRKAAGTASDYEVAQQESLAATQRASIPPLDITLRQSMAQLGVLTGRAPQHVTVRGGSLAKIAVPRVTPGLPAELLNQRPDIREAEAKLTATNYNVTAARAAFFPAIQLTGVNGWQSTALASLFTPTGWYYSAAASLAQPLFDGGQLLGQLELQHGLRAEALANYRKVVHSAFSDVEQALIALQQQTTRERLQQEVVRTSRVAFNLSEQRLRAGTVDLVSLIQIQQTLFTAEDLLAQIRLARFLAVISLYQALGGGWPPLEQPPV